MPEPENTSDGEVKPPSVNLPQPDEFDTSSRDGEREKKPNKNARLHPKDKYVDVRRKAFRIPGCVWGLGCLFTLGLLAILLVTGYLFVNPAIIDTKVVRLSNPEEIITEAPSEATLYLAPNSKVIYEAPESDVVIGIYAKEVEISGKFTDKVVLRGVKVTCKKDSVFEKDLNSKAVKFVDEGIEVNGKLESQTL